MVYPLRRLWYYPFWRVLIKKVKGMQNIPDKGNFIIVANHNKLLDPILVAYPIIKKLDKKVHFVASPRWWPYLGEYICRTWAGCIPLFNRKQAYKDAKKMINEGEIVGIFPEGNIKKYPRRTKAGAIRLAIETETPILPVKIESSYIPFVSIVSFDKIIYPDEIKKKYKNPERLMSKIYNLGLDEVSQREVIDRRTD